MAELPFTLTGGWSAAPSGTRAGTYAIGSSGDSLMQGESYASAANNTGALNNISGTYTNTPSNVMTASLNSTPSVQGVNTSPPPSNPSPSNNPAGPSGDTNVWPGKTEVKDGRTYRYQDGQWIDVTNEQNDRLRNEISSGWDSYLNSLNDMLNNGLSSQRQAQEGIAQEQYNQGVNTLGLQKDQGVQQIGKQRTEATDNQQKTLRDLAANIRNSMMAGNVYLGARGAGDSSAANMYSYALTKLGTQQRTDVMNQTSKIMSDINDRETNLNNIYNTEIKNLESEKNAKINQVASWFADAQNQIKQQMAQGQLGKSQDLASLSKDLLNRGLQEIDRINAATQSRYEALQSWAMSNSQNIQQLKQNMQAVQDVSYTMPSYQPISGQPSVDSSGNFIVRPYGYGYSNTDDQRNRLF